MNIRVALMLASSCCTRTASGSGVTVNPEYLAVYSLGTGGSHTLELGVEADEGSVEFMVVPSSSADREGLEEAEEVAAPAWEDISSGSREPTSLLVGSSAIPSRSVVYTVSLLVGGSSSATGIGNTTIQPTIVAVPLAIPEAGAYTVLLNHGEVSADLLLPNGETLAPVVSEQGHVHTEGEEDEDASSTATTRQWANALAASFLVSLSSFLGIITIASNRVAHIFDLSLALLFASGALLTTALVHIIPEAMEGLAQEYPDDLHDVALNSGISIMAGIFGGFILHVVLDDGVHTHLSDSRPPLLTAASPSPDEGASKAAVGGIKPTSAAARPDRVGSEPAGALVERGMIMSSLHGIKNAGAERGLFDVAGLDPVCWSVIVGDLAHNFGDGVTMGAAFSGCSLTVGWTIMAANMMHEIPHEVGDFIALVNGGMSVKQALLYNFFSGLFGVFGVVLAFSLQNLLTTTTISYILLVGAGTFIFVGLSELIPDALSSVSSPAVLDASGDANAIGGGGKKAETRSRHRRAQAGKALAFALGAVLLGLPLLTHEHCVADDGHHHH